LLSVVQIRPLGQNSIMVLQNVYLD